MSDDWLNGFIVGCMVGLLAVGTTCAFVNYYMLRGLVDDDREE